MRLCGWCGCTLASDETGGPAGGSEAEPLDCSLSAPLVSISVTSLFFSLAHIQEQQLENRRPTQTAWSLAIPQILSLKMNAATSKKDKSAENKVAGDPRSTKSAILETGAALTQV